MRTYNSLESKISSNIYWRVQQKHFVWSDAEDDTSGKIGKIIQLPLKLKPP